MVRVIKRALAEREGDMLVFLPGAGEIRRVQGTLADLGANIDVLPLYGELVGADQDAALRPARAGRRKIVLATNIAETSLTIDGVRIVVDAGLERRSLFDPASGMNRLELQRISRASAEQRAGRAGRTAPGVCYRLWGEGAERSLAAFAPPEIQVADLAPLALDLAVWGTDAEKLRWLDAPPAATLASARDLLHRLGALDAGGKVTRAWPRHAGISRASATRAHDAQGGRARCGAAGRGAGGACFPIAICCAPAGRAPVTATCARGWKLMRRRGARSRSADARARATRATQFSTVARGSGCAKRAAPVEQAAVLLALAYPDRVGDAGARAARAASSSRTAAARYSKAPNPSHGRISSWRSISMIANAKRASAWRSRSTSRICWKPSRGARARRRAGLGRAQPRRWWRGASSAWANCSSRKSR